MPRDVRFTGVVTPDMPVISMDLSSLLPRECASCDVFSFLSCPSLFPPLPLARQFHNTSKTPPIISANSSLPTFPLSPISFFNPNPKTNIRPSSGFREQRREASCVASSWPRVSSVGVPVPPRIVVAVWCESGRRVEGGRSESRSSEIVGSGPFVLLEGVGVRGTCI